jgi:DNA-binding transcriptional ArsR family regulator
MQDAEQTARRGRTEVAFTRPTADLQAIADALYRRDIPYEFHAGRQVQAGCPACGSHGRRGRRRVFIDDAPRGLLTDAKCRCRVTDIARALDLSPAALLSYSKTNVPSVRNAGGRADAQRKGTALPASAHHRGVSLAVTKLLGLDDEPRKMDWAGPSKRERPPGLRNTKGLRRVAEELDRRIARQDNPYGWVTFDSRGSADKLGMQRRTVQKNLDWLRDHGIVDERELRPPGETIVVASKRGTTEVQKVVKQYRLVSEAAQIERLSRRG